MTADLEQLRSSVVEGLQRAIDGISAGYVAPVHRKLTAEDDAYNAAVLCLGLGTKGGEEEKTLPCALALGLLEEMGRVFLGLEDGSSVTSGWGMPRTLNAADGLYTLAQHLIQSAEGLNAAEKLEALSIFHAAARDFSEALQAYSPGGPAELQKASRSLYPAAAAFAALTCDIAGSAKEELIALAQASADASSDLDAAFTRAENLLLPKA
jgi:hypothetical protein